MPFCMYRISLIRGSVLHFFQEIFDPASKWNQPKMRPVLIFGLWEAEINVIVSLPSAIMAASQGLPVCGIYQRESVARKRPSQALMKNGHMPRSVSKVSFFLKCGDKIMWCVIGKRKLEVCCSSSFWTSSLYVLSGPHGVKGVALMTRP